MKEYRREERVLGFILDDKAQENGNKPFLYFKDGMLSYEEVNTRANRVGNALKELGVMKGDKVGIMLPNCPEFLDSWFGLSKIGGVEVPINIAFKGFQLEHILNDTDVSLLIVDERFLERVNFIQDSLKTLKRIIVFKLEEEDVEIPTGLKFEQIPFEILYEGPPKSPDVEVKHSDLMAIMHTSGTTGPSKGVMLTHCHEYTLGWNKAINIKMTPQDVFYNYYPYFHNTGQAINTYATLLSDASLVIRDRFSVQNFWEDVKKYRCTVACTIGAMLDMLLKQPPTPEDGKISLRAAYVIAGNPETYKAFEKRFNVTLLEVYGSTEANVVTYMPYERRKFGSCGTVWPTFEVKIFDPEDNELPAKQVGEIVIRPKEPYTIIAGYYNNEKATLEAFRNLWFHTGDAGYFDEEGYLYFVDRIKDVIRRRGEFISSYDVERVINSHPSVLESAAVSVPSEFKGDHEIKVVIVLKEGKSLTPEELLSFCEERLAYFAVPRYVEFTDTLPKTLTNKIQKHILKAEGVTEKAWDRERAGYKVKRQ